MSSLADQLTTTQDKAKKVRQVIQAYFAAIEEQNKSKTKATEEAQDLWQKFFNKSCTDRCIRDWVKWIKECGGPRFAPIEAYCDRKSVPHPSRRLENKLLISDEFIAAFKAQCVRPGMRHIRAAIRKFELDWMMGRPVAGIGVRNGDEPFPYKPYQLRKFAPSTAAREMAAMGVAAAKRKWLPTHSNTAANLRRAEMLLFDDTRIDLIAFDNGKLVELKSYWAIDLASRRCEGFLIREAGNIRAEDVDILVARVLRSCGIAAKGSGYVTRLRFERGAVACSAARQSLLESLFPEQLVIERTGMDGGSNFPGDHVQKSSGRWMNKAHVESFIRTIIAFSQHMPGQRGSEYKKQPAHLGFEGKNDKKQLTFTAGSQMHHAAALLKAEQAMDAMSSLPSNVEMQSNGRIKITTLLPVRWVIDHFKEIVAYYNQRTDHRMEGFQRVEFLDKEGALCWRMESPDERAAWLESKCPVQRVSPSIMPLMLMGSKIVTVKRNGVSMDISPRTGLRFWKPNSLCCAEAGHLATGEKQYLALYDREALSLGQGVQEIYLCGKPKDDWRPGKPVEFIEYLPLYQPGDISNPADTARILKDIKAVEMRVAAEVAAAAEPLMKERIEEAKYNVSVLKDVVTSSLGTLPNNAPVSPFAGQLIDERHEAAELREELEEAADRSTQQENAQEQLARILAERKNQPPQNQENGYA